MPEAVGEERVDELRIRALLSRGPPDLNAIVVGNGPQNIDIDSNEIVGATTGIWFQPGATDSWNIDNRFIPGRPGDVLGQGTGTKSRNVP